jgi:hypothetical protein
MGMEIAIAARGTADHRLAADFARKVYAHSYGADVTPDPESFVVVKQTLYVPDDAIAACAGLTTGRAGKLFSENYLGEPVTDVIRRRFRQWVSHDQVAEIGPLCGGGGTGLELIRLLPILSWCQGMHFLLVTVTVQVAESLKRLKIPFEPLAAATTGWMSDAERARWGTYYHTAPVTGLVPLGDISELMRATTGRYRFTAPQVSTMFERPEAVAGARG